jgi:hypothetical protein
MCASRKLERVRPLKMSSLSDFQCEDVNGGLAPGFILAVVPDMRPMWIKFWKAVGLDPDEMRECTNYDVRQFNGLELIVEYALRGVDTTRQQWFATRFSPATKAPS